MRVNSSLRKQTILVRVPLSAYLFMYIFKIKLATDDGGYVNQNVYVIEKKCRGGEGENDRGTEGYHFARVPELF